MASNLRNAVAGTTEDVTHDRTELVANRADELKEKGKNAADDSVDETKDEASERGNALLDRVKGTAEDTRNKVYETKDEAAARGTRVVDKVKDTAGILKQKSEDAVENVKHKTDETADRGKGVLNYVKGVVTTPTAGEHQQHRPQKAEAPQPQQRNLREKYEEAKSKARDNAEKVKENTKQRMEAATEAGRGILDAIGDVASEFTDVLQGSTRHVQSVSAREVDAQRAMSAAQGRTQVPPNLAKLNDAAREETERIVAEQKALDDAAATASSSPPPTKEQDKSVIESVAEWVVDRKQQLTDEMTQRVVEAEKAKQDEERNKR
ncbi:uncharacterized protein LOC112344734 [Selaginella moellendorffii]|uniref:uncharacterized protein LOC112344734 n=1 Tax=Selaginella moellendorffii TaxID=88036 RepID=UPI000D1CE458|nr:uncharacterized protein LOC112344734 [Selaginella moellendorffii]|eukprot:XP_024525831.1 uncharacterized protein LOC112344734 [Selaginella moellendorffii]